MRRSAGFSLVEILLATAILGVGLVGLTEGLTLALRSSKEAERQSRAALLAAGRMELARLDRFILEGEEEGTFGGELGAYRWRQTISRTELEGLYEVAVAVELEETGEELFELRTLIFEKPFESLLQRDERSESQSGRGLARRPARGGAQ
jgi:prepilin-type N-terminal cleavage/methylation domain-containing protein